MTRPGPGFFPFWLALGLALASVALLPEVRAAPPAQFGGLRRAGLAAGVVVGYGLLIEHLGLGLTTFAFLLALWAVVDRQPMLRATVLAGITTAATWVLFDIVLRVRFPRGPLGF